MGLFGEALDATDGNAGIWGLRGVERSAQFNRAVAGFGAGGRNTDDDDLFSAGRDGDAGANDLGEARDVLDNVVGGEDAEDGVGCGGLEQEGGQGAGGGGVSGGGLAEDVGRGEPRKLLGDDALEQIDRKVLQLFALVGESVSGATDALLSGDREAAKVLADRDEVVDSLYHDIEQLTLEQLTVAGITSPEDLRFLVTVIRMLPDLERNGDLAEHVARRAARGLGAELSARSRGLVERMGEVAIHMWRATTDAYAERLPMSASQLDTLDDEMDDLHVSLTVEVVAGTMPLPVAVELAMVTRFYERFGDHAVNLAKRVAVLVPSTGQSA